jgi:hypothetical protein
LRRVSSGHAREGGYPVSNESECGLLVSRLRGNDDFLQHGHGSGCQYAAAI